MESNLEFFANYGLFLAKTITALIAIGLLLSLIANAKQKMRDTSERGHIEITKLNQQYEQVSEAMMLAVLDESEQKAMLKQRQKEKKKQAKASKKEAKKNSVRRKTMYMREQKNRVFVIKFDGNISAQRLIICVRKSLRCSSHQ